MSTNDANPHKGSDYYANSATIGEFGMSLAGVHGTPNQTDEVSVGEFIDSVLADSESMAMLRETIGELEERVESVERLEARLREAEAGVEGVDDLSRALLMVVQNLSDVEANSDEIGRRQAVDHQRLTTLEEELVAEKARADELERRLEAIEVMFSERALGKEQSHVRAQRRDPSDIVSVGDVREVCVQEVEGGYKASAMARIQGLVTWIDLQRLDDSKRVSAGDVLEVQITDLKDSNAEAVPLEVIRRDRE